MQVLPDLSNTVNNTTTTVTCYPMTAHLVEPLVDRPILMGSKADASTIAAASVVSGSEGVGTLPRQLGEERTCTPSNDAAAAARNDA
jgi:hypothetical protein